MSQQSSLSYKDVPPTNNTAVISLVLSFLGLIGILPFVGSVIGIVVGNMAKNEIARSGGAQRGEGLAQAGIILGVVGVLMWVLGLCVVFLFVGFGFSIGACAILQEWSSLPLWVYFDLISCN